MSSAGAGADGKARESHGSSYPGASGVQHRRRDFYSENNPVPSIQRFFRRGLVDALSSLKAGSDSEEEEEGRKTGGKLTDRLGRRLAEHEQKGKEKEAEDESEEEDGAQDIPHTQKTAGCQRRTHKPRLVHDPISRAEVYIHDVGKREYEDAMRQADDGLKSPERRGMASGSAAEAATETSERRHGMLSGGSLRRLGHRKSKSTASEGGGADVEGVGDRGGGQQPSGKVGQQTENVLTMAFPPAESLPDQLHRLSPTLIVVYAVWATAVLLDVIPRLVSVLVVPYMAWWTLQSIAKGAEDNRWERERTRGRQASRGQKFAHFDQIDEPHEGIKEGAEWLNAVMEGLWAVMNPDLFSSLGATLEDVMQASIPRFIHAVKVEDLAQGSTPLRLTGFRVLPDAEAQDIRAASMKHARQERMKEESKLKRADGERPGGQNGDGERSEREEAGGASFINLEMSFIYRARPTSDSVASKGRNAHLLIKFWVGAKKLVTVPLPVWVEIKGLVGSVRARIQLTSDPPFVKNVTFSFMGLPRVGVEVIPLHINTSNIPLLSGFIQSSIDAAMGEYCAPSSLTMDLGEILMGDNVKREVDALGVMVIYIHSASDLEKQDVQGSSDPYCTVQLAKHGKIQYATRVALNDLSPRWEERYVMLINPEAVRAREKISIGLWDSDRFSADDMLGRAEVDLIELVKRPGRLFKRTDTLVGLTQEMEKQGLLHWSVGFFAKTPNRRRLVGDHKREREETEAERMSDGQTEGVDVDQAKEEDVGRDFHVTDGQGANAGGDVPLTGQDIKDMHLDDFDDRGTAEQTRNVEHAVSFEPPDPMRPSGILSMQIHHISDLEVVDTRVERNSRRHNTAQPGQEVEQVESQEDRPNAPSAYVTIILNDETVFRSRTKALSSNPFFNAGTERFIRDWRRTLIMFVAYDNRLREEDAILGVVPIKLFDLFSSTSQVTTVFPLAGGVGRGHLRISLLFRPIANLSRHKTKLGWDIGTMRILSSINAVDFADAEDVATFSSASIRAKTLAGSARISSRRARSLGDGAGVEWYLGKEDFPVKVPVRRRYATPFVIELRSPSAASFGIRRTAAVCIIWMQDVADDDVVEYRLPIWRARDGGDLHRLLQNYQDFRNEAEAEQLDGVVRVGYLTVKMQFKSGVGDIHTKFDGNPDAKVVMDAWRACTSVGLRNVTGDFVDMQTDTRGMPMNPSCQTDEIGTELAGEGKGHRRSRSGQTSISRRSGEAQSRSADSSFDGDDDEGGDAMSKIKKWSQERKELHRQHRGIKQYKGVRTAAWIGRGVRDRGSRAMQSLRLQDRRARHVETEM